MRKGWNRTLNLLLKNSFKNTFASWGVVVGLTLLIALLALIISLMTSISARVVGNYSDLNKASNLRDALIDLQPGDFVGKDKEGDGAPDNVVEAQQFYVYKLNQKYKYENPNYQFYWSRTEGRNFAGLYNGSNDLTVKAVAKFTPNSSAQNVDSLTISEGHGIQSDHQTVIDATFAQKNHIHIGDIIRIQEDGLGSQLKVNDPLNKMSADDQAKINTIKNLDDPNDEFNKEYSTYKWLQVVGFGESADFAMPIVDDQTPLPNKSTELICYVSPDDFGLISDTSNNQGFRYFDQARSTYSISSSSDGESYYSLKFKNNKFKPTKSDIDKINRDFVTMIGKDNGGATNPTIVYLNDDKDYQYAGRTSSLATTIKIYNVISAVILIVVALVVIFSVILVTRKQIDKTRSQIGVTKALGYQKRQIVFNYISLPFITSLTGGIIGFIIAQAIQGPIISLFKTYFNLDISNWSFDILGFFITVVIMWFVISAISFLIAYSVMRHDTLELLTASKASHISRFGQWIKSLNPAKTVTSTMKSALLASNSGKMLSVSLIVLLATIIMTASFMTPTMLNDNKTKSYNGINYKQLVEYSSPIYNDPYTFMKTYDTQQSYQSFEYSDQLQKITSKPLIKNDDGSYGGYDMDAIMNQLKTGQISNEYYDLEFGASAVDGDNKVGLPNPLQEMMGNIKMLNPYSVTLSNSYFKELADWAIVDPFGWNILSNQWPGYLSMVQELRTNETKYTGDDLLRNDFLTLQAFYKTYTEAIGLTISRDLYDYQSVGKQDYQDHNYTNQIDLFNGEKTKDGKQISNGNDNGKQKAFRSYKEEKTGSTSTFGSFLTNPNNGLSLSSDFSISDGDENPAVKANHIWGKNGESENKNNKYDIYLVADPDNMSADEMKSYISDYLTWYGTYFSMRSGAAIIAAASTRPPYFVQQYLKTAYYKNDPNLIYNVSFSTIPLDPLKDEAGTEISAETLDNGNKKPLDFKIYGINQTNYKNKFVDLEDSKGNNLIKNLFATNEDDNEPGIVINQSLATKLGLKTNDTIDLNVLYKELESYQNGQQTAFNVDDWSQSGVRGTAKSDGYISTFDMDTFATQVKDPVTGKSIAMTKGSTNVTNAPGDLYQEYLAGNIGNADKKKQQTFKVVGIHNGYGTPAAWIQNNDAEKIMQYDKTREYLWNTLFTQQFANEFNQVKYQNEGLYLPYNLTNYGSSNGSNQILDYQTFLDNFVNNPDSEYQQAAQNINQIFENAYPVFNFKFSMNDDIGDIKAGVATYTSLGDYSPITMNGGVAGNTTYDGIGTGSIAALMPVQISKDILNQMSGVIMAIIAIIITLVVVLTFIIIMLTTTLIISDNMRFIATMKVLGYTNRDIVNVVLGMYAIAIVIMYVLGFIIGWFMLTGIVHNLAMSSSFVLPLVFPWWLLFAVMLAVCGIYIITFIVGFNRVSKAKPIAVLQNQEI